MTKQNENKKGNFAKRISSWLYERKYNILMLIFCVGSIIGCAKYLKPKPKKVAKTEEKVVYVTVEKIKPVKSLWDSYEITGDVEENLEVDVSAEVGARVVAYAAKEDKITTPYKVPVQKAGAHFVEEGQFVKKGQVLMYLETDRLAPQRDRAYAQYENAKADRNRIRDAYSRGLSTDKERDNANMQYVTAKANYEEAQAKLDRWVIRATESGILNKISVEVGEYVNDGTVVAQIVDVSKVKFVFKIAERDIGFIRKGAEQSLRVVDPFTNKVETLKGKISYVDRMADKLTKTTRIEIQLDNPKMASGMRKFRTGNSVKAIMQRRELKNVILVPLSAVIPMEKGGRTFHVCYVEENGIAKRKVVTLGMFKGQKVMIRTGLKAGENLIVLGAKSGVGPDQKVIVTNRKKETASEKSDAKTDKPALVKNKYFFHIETKLAGAVPVEIESTITTPIENALTELKNCTSIHSVSMNGKSIVQAEFKSADSKNELLAKIKSAIKKFEAKLPEAGERPVVTPVDKPFDFQKKFGGKVSTGGKIDTAKLNLPIIKKHDYAQVKSGAKK